MRRWLSLFLLTLAGATAGIAQDAELQQLESGTTARAWEAVGRLDLGGAGFCTGALIAPNLVLTAAHCLFEKGSGSRVNESEIEFLAGWRNGRASAYRSVRKAVTHPDYTFGGDLDSNAVRFDLALLELDHPIRNGQIEPFATTHRPNEGDQVGVVSYAKNRSEAPSLQEICEVLGHREGVLVTSCSVDFGASGAPIFTFKDGRAQIVSVVSAKASMEGEDVSLGTSLNSPLEALYEEIKSDHIQSNDAGPLSRRIVVGGVRTETGAKFVKP
ncbi:MAG: trypsin-like serine protease [Paracoccaceae bacterium]